MKVLHVVHGLGAELGGLSKAVFGLSRALKSANVEVEIATTHAHCQPYSGSDDTSGIPVHIFRHMPMAGLKYSHALSSWLEKNVSRFDIVHVHGVFNHPAISAMHACNENKTPFVLSVHGMLNEIAVGQKSLKKKLFWHLAQKKPLLQAARLHALTRYESDQLRQWVPATDIDIIPNGIEKEEFLNRSRNKLQKQERELKNILYLGRIDPIKGIENLLQAIPLVRTDTEIRWKIAGGGESGYIGALKNLAASLNESKHIEFMQEQNEQQARFLIENADVFVQPSHSEGFSIVLLEAMALGTPVVMSKGCHFDYALKDDLAIVIENNPDDLASAISQILNNEQASVERATRAQKVVTQEFIWTALSEKYMGLYRSAIRHIKDTHFRKSS